MKSCLVENSIKCIFKDAKKFIKYSTLIHREYTFVSIQIDSI